MTKELPNPLVAEAEPAMCPHCEGSGSQTYMTTEHGPDDYEFDGNCEHCDGEGTLAMAYAGVVRLLNKSEKEYRDACGRLWAVSHMTDVLGWRARPNAHQEWELILPKSPELTKAVEMRWELVPLMERPTYRTRIPARKAIASASAVEGKTSTEVRALTPLLETKE